MARAVCSSSPVISRLFGRAVTTLLSNPTVRQHARSRRASSVSRRVPRAQAPYAVRGPPGIASVGSSRVRRVDIAVAFRASSARTCTVSSSGGQCAYDYLDLGPALLGVALGPECPSNALPRFFSGRPLRLAAGVTMPRKRIAIACQGGGSQCAFVAGALKTLFAQGVQNRFKIVGLSGTSGGALTAALAWAACSSRRMEMGRRSKTASSRSGKTCRRRRRRRSCSTGSLASFCGSSSAACCPPSRRALRRLNSGSCPR